MTESLSIRIGRHLTDNAPLVFCDACLALRMEETLQDAREAAIILARERGFMRKVSVCYGCRRAVEMTVGVG